MKLVKTGKLTELYRDENYRGNTTATVEWVLFYKGRKIGTYSTKKAALELFLAYDQ